MPSTGFYLFLQLNMEHDGILFGCQCPQRASTYFFGLIQGVTFSYEMCQCPQRASTYFFFCIFSNLCTFIYVSMPSTGFYLFLHRLSWYINESLSVSMPSTGFYLFLPPQVAISILTQFCVNALNGLLLISSVPSQNP